MNEIRTTVPTNRTTAWVSIAIIALGIAARLAGARGELWLDEIWSLNIADEARSWSDIFLRIRHDNNHHLNTLYLVWLGGDRSAFVYRALSLLFGCATLVLLFYALRNQSAWRRIVTMMLFSSSFLLTNYASEARGYGGLVFFTLGGFLCLESRLRSGRNSPLVGYWICSAMGFLSHLTFLQFFIAAVAWSSVELTRKSESLRSFQRKFFILHAFPLGFLVLFYYIALRGMNYGGADEMGLFEVAGRIASLTLGLQEGATWRWIAILAIAAIGIAELRVKYNDGDTLWIFYFVAIVVSPLVVWILHPSLSLAPRYFLTSALFLLLLISSFLARNLERGGVAQITALLLLQLVFAGNVWKVENLITIGRGHYAECLETMVAKSIESTVQVTGNHDIRVGMVLNYYTARGTASKRIEYISMRGYTRNSNPPEWFIAISPPGSAAILPPVRRLGASYEKVKVFHAYGLSGLDWHLYHRKATR